MIGKFSIRTVPDQEPEQIVSLTEGYLRKLWSTRGSPNKMSVRGEGERGWLADTNTVNFKAASRFGTYICVLSWVASKGLVPNVVSVVDQWMTVTRDLF